MSDYTRLIRSSPEISLLRSRHLDLVAEVVDRAFRGDSAAGVRYRDMLRIITEVLGEFRDASGGDESYDLPAEHYLRLWIGTGRNLEEGLWFHRDQDRDGDWIRLHGHARRVIEQLLSLSTPYRAFGSRTMIDLFRKVLDASTRLDRNRERALMTARAERERLDILIADLEEGEAPPEIREEELEGIGSEILKTMSDLRVAIAEVPDLLRRINRENRETLNRTDGSTHELIREVIARGQSARLSANGYQFVKEVYRLYLDEDRIREFELAIQTVIERVGPYLTRSDARRMRSFLGELHLIASGIDQEDYQDLFQKLERIESDLFGRTLHEGRTVRRVFETMTRLRRELNPTIQDPHVSGLGITLEPQLNLLPSSGFRLSEVDPVTTTRHYRDVGGAYVADPGRVERALRDAEREAMADPKEIKRLLDLILSRREEVTLAEALALFPPRGGVQEVAGWLTLAASRVPALYRPGEVTIVHLPEGEPAGPLLVLNPLFLRHGSPGEGLNEAVRYAEANGLLSPILKEIEHA
jgi:hypothetical protein